MAAALNLYKQILMHILHRSSLPLPQSVLLDVVVVLGYTDYINAQSALGELVESELVSEENTYHRSYVKLTEAGEETRRLFERELSPDIRKEIDEYLKNNHIETRNETALVSDYHRTANGMYSATCSLHDGSHLLYEITMEVSTEADAARICNAWERRAQTLYADSLQQLLGSDASDEES